MNGDAVTWRMDVTPNGNRELVIETINNAPLLKWLLQHGDQYEHCLEVTDEPMYPKEHLMPPPVVYNNAILIESSDEDEDGALNFKSLPPKPPKMPQEPTSVAETIPVESKRAVTLTVTAKAAEPPKVSKKLTLDLEPRPKPIALEPRPKPIATTAATAKSSKAKASSSSSSSSAPVPKVKAEPKKAAPKAAAKATATKAAGALDADEFYYDPPSPSQAKPRRTRPVKPSSALDEMATVDFAVKAVLSTPPKALAAGGANSAAPHLDASASAATATACKRESGAAVAELFSALTSDAKAASPASTATAADAKPTRSASSRWRSAKSTPPPFATERRPNDTARPHTPPADDAGGDSDDDAAFWDTYRGQLLRFPSPAQRQAPSSARPPVDVYPRDIGGIAVTKQGTVYGKGHRLEPLCDSTALYFRQRNAAALYRRFQEQGYLVIRRLLPPGYVLAARRRIIRILRAQQFLTNAKAPLPTLDAARPVRDDGDAATKKRPLGGDAPGAAAKKLATRLATTLQLDASSDEDDAASADDATGAAGHSDDSDAELRADASLISEDDDDAEEERYGHTVLHRQGLIVHVDDSGVITGSARYAATLALDSDSDEGGARGDTRSGGRTSVASAAASDAGDDDDDDPREWRSVRRSASVNRVVQNAQVRRLLRFLAVGKTLCDEDLYHQTLATLRDADRDAAAAPPSASPPPRLGPVRHSARLFHPQFTWLRVKAPMECTPEHADGIFFLEHTEMYAANPKLPGGSCLLCVDGASGRLLGGDARRAPGGGDDAGPVCQLCRSHSCAKSAALHAQLVAAARTAAPPAPKPPSRAPPAATLLYLSSSSGGDSSGDEARAPATYNTRHSARSESTAASQSTAAASAAPPTPPAPPQLFLRCDDCHRCFHVDCLPLAAVREGHITHHYLQAAEEAGAAKMAASHPNVHGLARHQLPADDWHCPDCLPRPTLATCWVPLERALPLSQGTLVLLPHSHQRIRFFHRYQRSYQVPQSYTKDTRQLNWHFPPRGFRAGDVVVFDARLMHGSTRNYTSQFRMSLDFRWMLLPHRDGGDGGDGDAVGKRPLKTATNWSPSSPRPAWRPATAVHPTATERFVLANTTELRADA